jgi:hypothetical protein
MKLTPALLRKLVLEEVSKLKSDAVDNDAAVETDADELADSLEKHIDFIKALKIKESKLNASLKKVREQKALAYRRILDSK